ncbi:GEVED domain-containing protein [Lacinutrix himadriensis]|uniref:GEVED domain-containing protein n=1 Tax=Lacinutrix himadriensis TaxID=641549 RepID=UPI000AAD9032|nr:GEVED domain-containing protein [Lacinutrix himadriensis]
MKKITQALVLFFTLLAIGVQAQTFPAPYCEIEEPDIVTVEEITSVSFAGTSITNVDIVSVLVDETATIINITQDQTYTLEATGNTYGPFDTDIVAFIDWNQNDILDDVGETYAIGTLFNSTGSDGTSVTMDITVPVDAVPGNTRIRITKTYQDPDSPAEVNPCGIQFNPFGVGIYSGFGQALDFTLDVEALVFPAPYCEITDASNVTVEEITSVSFAGTSITNTDAVSVLIDETATNINVSPDQTYTLEVTGNTYGPFDTDIVAFIDWNQNDVLDDAGETYAIGTLFNSTGSDGDSVTMDIAVPIDAVPGETRIRITKTYQDPDSPAEVNPCGIQFNAFGQGIYPGYGQALDFTLNIAALSIAEFDINALSVYPIPAKDILHIKYKSALSAVKIYNLLGQEVYTQKTNASNLQLDISTLSAATYVVKLITEKGQHNFRIIKQ